MSTLHSVGYRLSVGLGMPTLYVNLRKMRIVDNVTQKLLKVDGVETNIRIFVRFVYTVYENIHHLSIMLPCWAGSLTSNILDPYILP
jgi:hypothetical protein